MKKIINKVSLFLLTVSLIGCSSPDNVIYDVFDGVSHGAVLRTLERTNVNFNLFDLNSTFDITVEAQDEENGALLSKVDVFVNFTDLTPGNDNTKAEVLVKSIPAASFTTSANGLPSTRIVSTFTETLAALGLAPGEYNGGDALTFRLELVLTNGRTFSAADGSGSLQGSYFSSPYSYAAGILCIPASPITGTYVIDMVDNYGDGWQGSAVKVTIDGVATSYSIPDLWSAGLGGGVGDPLYTNAQETVVVPPGTASLTFEYVAGSYPGECEFTITNPSGFVGIAAGPAPVAGVLALNLCNE